MEKQYLVWILSSPVFAEINDSMQDFPSIYVSNDQNKDASAAQQERYFHHTKKFIHTLSMRFPFSQRGGLYNLDSGVCAADNVSSEAIVADMADRDAINFTFMKADQVVTMSKKFAVCIGSDRVDIEILFQQVVTAGLNSVELEQVLGLV